MEASDNIGSTSGIPKIKQQATESKK